ncbi:ferredoxin reductase family protein [Xanthobacter agilis]|uniref:ferredoxin reductase family protein n=1 Tax=Xanthobacter agilis TaxID=47492 RepID=UPI0037286B2C
MRNIQILYFSVIALIVVLWVFAEGSLFSASNFFQVRDLVIQSSGVLAIGLMSIAMMLALRPRWPERWFGGLDKMYRLHKWLGISILVVATFHWLWAEGPKWASGLGLIEGGARPTRAPIADPVQAFLTSLRGSAESVGEWAFYAAALLMILALVKYFPYRLFYKTHRLLAVAYLVLSFHAMVLTKFSYWMSPLGLLLALLLVGGVGAAVIVLLGLRGKGRQVWGRIATLHYYPGVRTLEIAIDMAQGWPGHKAGQFAFAMSDPSEGPHPYTIASSWHDGESRISFIAKELGDHTSRLKDKLSIGQEVRIEGPYGRFTFDDDFAHQIWIAGGIGITPFIARMKHMALLRDTPDWPKGQVIDLFHTTSEVDEEALAKLAADALNADVRLHLLIDARDGQLTGDRLRAAVPDWSTTSIWFCGPTGFADALKRDLAAKGFPTDRRFHQELFAMR